MQRVLCVLVIASAAACGSDTPTSPDPPREILALRFQTDHFRVLAGSTPDAILHSAAARLEVEHPRIVSALGVTALPTITVRVWQDEATYFDELVRYFGVRYSALGYITGPTELRMLASPTLPTTAVHEFVHAASMAVNASFANNPRWLWETVALYENGEFVHPRTIPYLVSGAFPTLQRLNVDPNGGRQIYEVGYVLGEFIVSTWGRPAYLRLILANGDIGSVLGVSVADFESAWRAFVQQRYLSSMEYARTGS